MVNGRLFDSASMNEVGLRPKNARPGSLKVLKGNDVPVDAEQHTHGKHQH